MITMRNSDRYIYLIPLIISLFVWACGFLGFESADLVYRSEGASFAFVFLIVAPATLFLFISLIFNGLSAVYRLRKISHQSTRKKLLIVAYALSLLLLTLSAFPVVSILFTGTETFLTIEFVVFAISLLMVVIFGQSSRVS